jgi:hypothetical protein
MSVHTAVHVKETPPPEMLILPRVPYMPVLVEPIVSIVTWPTTGWNTAVRPMGMPPPQFHDSAVISASGVLANVAVMPVE